MREVLLLAALFTGLKHVRLVVHSADPYVRGTSGFLHVNTVEEVGVKKDHSGGSRLYLPLDLEAFGGRLLVLNGGVLRR